MNIQKLYKSAWLFQNKKYRKLIITVIKAWEKQLAQEAKKGKFQLMWTTIEGESDQHFTNIVAFRWLMRYSKNKPILKDQKIWIGANGKRYIEKMQIIYSWDLSNGHK